MKTRNLTFRLASLAISLFISLTSFAATKLTGTLMSPENEAIPFANIAVTQNNQLVSGTVSDNSGHFELNIDSAGTYTLSITHILYMPFSEEEKIDSKDLNLGIISLTTNNETLDEVKVIAQDMIHKSDRDIILMNNKYTAMASNTEQVFQMLPSVSVDMVNRNIKVAGKENVLLQVNGIEKDEQYIRTLSPSKIKKIEIIKNVTGRYANEYDAILNIITDNDQTGYSAYAEDFSYLSLEDSYNDIVLNNIKVNGSWFTSKTNIYAGYTNHYNGFYVPETTASNYDDGFTVNKTIDVANNQYSSSSNKVYFGADYTFKPGNILSAEIKYTYSPEANNKKSSLSDVTVSDNDEVINTYQEKYTTKAKNTNPYILLTYEGKLSEKNNLSTGISYYNNHNIYSNTVATDDVTYLEEGDATKNYVDYYLEDLLTINDKLSVNFNYNFRTQKTDNSYTVDGEKEPDSQNKMTKHNAGVYLNYKLSDKTDLKAGCAIENLKLLTVSNNIERTSDQHVLLPNFSIKHSISDALALKINYKVNTKNPNMSQLSPYTSVVDSFTTKTGNPLLKPSYYHYISGTLDLAGGGIVLEPYYKFGNNIISEIGTTTEDHIVEYNYTNSADYQKYGINLTGNFSTELDNKDLIYFSLDIDKYWEKSNYAGNSHHLTDIQINSQLAYISNKHNAMIAATYNNINAKNITPMGYYYGNNDYLALTVKKGFCKDHIEFSAHYITPFNAGFTTKIDDAEYGTDYTKINSKDVSLVQNSFIFEIIFKLNKNKNTNTVRTKRRKADNDKVQTGLM